MSEIYYTTKTVRYEFERLLPNSYDMKAVTKSTPLKFYSPEKQTNFAVIDKTSASLYSTPMNALAKFMAVEEKIFKMVGSNRKVLIDYSTDNPIVVYDFEAKKIKTNLWSFIPPNWAKETSFAIVFDALEGIHFISVGKARCTFIISDLRGLIIPKEINKGTLGSLVHLYELMGFPTGTRYNFTDTVDLSSPMSISEIPASASSKFKREYSIRLSKFLRDRKIHNENQEKLMEKIEDILDKKDKELEPLTQKQLEEELERELDEALDDESDEIIFLLDSGKYLLSDMLKEIPDVEEITEVEMDIKIEHEKFTVTSVEVIPGELLHLNVKLKTGVEEVTKEDIAELLGHDNFFFTPSK